MFVSLDKACPVYFSMNISTHQYPNFRVRGEMVYSRPEDFSDAVQRCINHRKKGKLAYNYN